MMYLTTGHLFVTCILIMMEKILKIIKMIFIVYLKNTADRDMNLDTMAYAIDKRLPKVFPKLIRRVDLGPIHNVFAKDENEVTHAILEGIANKEIPLESYAISFKYRRS